MSEYSGTAAGAVGRWRAWWGFALVSAIFFHITASTFTSLGVALPFMIDDLGWSRTSAGLGFSVLSFMVGISGRVPSWTLGRFGVRGTFALGGVIMALGFTLLASTRGTGAYFVGAALAGLGYPLNAIVPGVAIINRWLPERRSFAIGAYMTIGGLGGVAGPLIVTQVVALTGSWRVYWWLMAASIVVLAGLAAASLRGRAGVEVGEEEVPAALEKRAAGVHVTPFEWDFRDVLRTPQYYLIVAAMTMTLFAGVTTNSWAVSHMGDLGVAIGVAAGALSAQALVNALSRALGGVLATRIDPKWLLAAALAAGAVGMLALAVADNLTAIALFAFGEGFGFGMCLYATAILLVNYYGADQAPKTMGTMHMITTVAMLGPVLGGSVAETFGGFGGLFRVYAAILALVGVLVVAMRPPVPPRGTQTAGGAATDGP